MVWGSVFNPPCYFQKGTPPILQVPEVWVDRTWKKRRKKGAYARRGWVIKLGDWERGVREFLL